MKRFIATKYDEKSIELTSSEELEKLFETIEAEENFLLKWEEGNVEQAQVMRGNDIKSKITTGDMKLSSKQSIKKRIGEI